jgi:acyl-CoA synthetase (AMP-forming)/AMP-acid ligase II/L-amino acid N-acyltransferase YncA/acyl carrier protein
MEQTVDVQKASGRARATSVVDEFERQVDTDPSRDAIRRGDTDMVRNVSFGQLDAWANAIASELIYRRGRNPEPVPLAVCSPDLMLAAALGVLKAGKFYVAVNPMHPVPHVQRVLDELDAPLLLCDRPGEGVARRGQPAVSVEEVMRTRPSEGRPELRFDESRLAYVLYTSGSTGRPRGVAQSRRDMLHNVVRHRALRIGSEDCATLISADGFVASVSNPYVALLGGAALAPYSFKDLGVVRMIDWLKAAGVTVLYAFPSFLRQLAAAETTRVHSGLRLAYLGGESVLPTDLAAARRLFTEATLGVGLNSSETGLTCLHLIPPGSPLPDPVPVGRPVVDVEVTILDESGTPLPPGTCGEIEIRSAYVRPRYWSRGATYGDDLPAPGFRTGDRGRMDGNGMVYHVGRADEMLKVRGFRVECTEVETAISRLPGVAEVAVFGIGDDRSAVELAACVVGEGAGIDPVTVRGAVARELPSAMIPTRVSIAGALPRTPNGKLDRKSLARLVDTLEPDATGAPTTMKGSSASPPAADGGMRAAVERQIAEIWRSELEIDDVPDGEDFFALGGTSLTAVSVISRVRGEFGVPVPLAVLFRTPTVSALAAAVIECQNKLMPDDASAARHISVRCAREHDFPDICTLVNHYIEHTGFNFRTEPQTPGEWIAEWSATRARYPWLVANRNGAIAGIAYAGPWKGRAAYDWCAEVTVYVAHDAQRMGIGRTLYRRLLAMLDSQGYRTQVAVIALPNAPSVALHEACRFRHAGTLREVGYKHGAWLDVGFWQRSRPARDEPPAPIAVVPKG